MYPLCLFGSFSVEKEHRVPRVSPHPSRPRPLSLVTADLSVAFAGGRGGKIVGAAEDGVFAVAAADAEEGETEAAVFFAVEGVFKKGDLPVFVVPDAIAADVQTADRIVSLHARDVDRNDGGNDMQVGGGGMGKRGGPVFGREIDVRGIADIHSQGIGREAFFGEIKG